MRLDCFISIPIFTIRTSSSLIRNFQLNSLSLKCSGYDGTLVRDWLAKQITFNFFLSLAIYNNILLCIHHMYTISLSCILNYI